MKDLGRALWRRAAQVRHGLGLAVAQSLVKARSGRIWIESTPGEGTIFRFTLPLLEKTDGSRV